MKQVLLLVFFSVVSLCGITGGGESYSYYAHLPCMWLDHTICRHLEQAVRAGGACVLSPVEIGCLSARHHHKQWKKLHIIAANYPWEKPFFQNTSWKKDSLWICQHDAPCIICFPGTVICSHTNTRCGRLRRETERAQGKWETDLCGDVT